MKKYILAIFSVICLSVCINNTYAISSNFKFVIDTVGIPRYNTYGDEINEDVYYAYNVFSYGKPNKITNSQRWKNSKYGLWTKNGGRYKGSGTRGEYYILGTSYSGALIYNYYFPMDVIPSTTPDKWTFYTYPEARDSWKDTTKYKYKEQLEYMKNAKLMFNDISSRDKADNPKYIKEYNITAMSIGLNKARLDTAATWKTYGMISTRRNISGVIYSQVYLVKPMAANADVKSTLSVEDNFVLDKNQDELIIPIEYETKVINMTGYADKKHIKEIKSLLYINGQKVDEVSGSKIISVGNEYMLVITRDNYPPNNNYNIEILVDGYMHTEFAVDGLMRNKVSKNINVYIEKKQIIPVKSTSVKVLEKNSVELVVRPLAQNIETMNKSEGFSEAGKYLAIKLNLNVNKEELKDIRVYIDSNEISYNNNYSSNAEIIAFKIPESTNTSLFGEYSLRKENGDYFNISKTLVGTRKDEPHSILIKYKFDEEEYGEEFLIDTLDSVLTNINNKLLISTNYSENDIMPLKEWLKQDE